MQRSRRRACAFVGAVIGLVGALPGLPAGAATTASDAPAAAGPAAVAAPAPAPAPAPVAAADAATLARLQAAGAATVFVSGSAVDAGSTGRTPLTAPLIDLVATRTGQGYWLLAQDGGVFSYGDAAFYGSTGNIRLNQPVVAMTASPTGNGYLFVANDGGVFAFGDAAFHGSIPGILPPGGRLNQPIVGIVPTTTGNGYWMVAADGGVFAFGDAGFVGSLGANPPTAPIQAFVPTTTANGYWMIDAAGTIHPFGDAPAIDGLWAIPGSTYPADGLPGRAVADAAAIPDGSGLVVVLTSGAVLAGPYDASDDVGSAPVVNLGPDQTAAALAVSPDGDGLWVASTGAYVPRHDAGEPGGPHAVFPSSNGRAWHWSACAVIDWYYNPAFGPADGLAFVTPAMEHVAALSGFTLRYAGTTSAAPNRDYLTGAIVVGWHDRPDATSYGGRRYGAGGLIVAGGVEMSALLLGPPYSGYLPLAHGPGSIGSILLHEIAHAFGIDHSVPASVQEIMSNGAVGRYGPGDLEAWSLVDARNGC